MKSLKYICLLAFCVCGLTGKAQTPEQLKAWLPSIGGWEITEEIEVFNPENLFDRINGAAPLFLENNFREMTSLEYVGGEDYITIQAYRHATPEDAFGMYSVERTPELPNYPIGGEAQGDEVSFFFFAGNIYVKMWGTSEGDLGDVLMRIAKGLADKIDPDAAYPPLVAAFPEEGKKEYSEAYITANYIGHEFLKNVYLARYEKDGKPFQLFLIDAGTPEKAKDVLAKYYAFARQEVEIREGQQVVADRYNGDVPILWQGRYLLGVFSENGDALDFADLLMLMAERL